MASKSYHVIPAIDGGWAVTKEGAHRASRTFETKESAVEWARELSRTRGTELYIHKQDGRIADHFSYRKEPAPAEAW